MFNSIIYFSIHNKLVISFFTLIFVAWSIISFQKLPIDAVLGMRSFSRFGLSLVTIVFSNETDVYWARQQVSKRLAQVKNEIPASLGNPGAVVFLCPFVPFFQPSVATQNGVARTNLNHDE